MTFRISGQVPFEDVKEMLDPTQAIAPQMPLAAPGDGERLVIARWALERFGRHLKSCPVGRTTDDGMHEEPECTCGLQWALEKVGAK